MNVIGRVSFRKQNTQPCPQFKISTSIGEGSRDRCVFVRGGSDT